MVMGLVMVGGHRYVNKSPVDLTQTTPIATLTAEPEVIVVRSDSKVHHPQAASSTTSKPTRRRSSGAAVRPAAPTRSWSGCSPRPAAPTPRAVNKQYVAYSGGGEVKAALLSGDVSVAGVSSASEFQRPG